MEAGQKAIVIKDQHMPSADTANIIQKYIVGDAPFRIFGSVALNNAAGGVNPSCRRSSAWLWRKSDMDADTFR